MGNYFKKVVLALFLGILFVFAGQSFAVSCQGTGYGLQTGTGSYTSSVDSSLSGDYDLIIYLTQDNLTGSYKALHDKCNFQIGIAFVLSGDLDFSGANLDYVSLNSGLNLTGYISTGNTFLPIGGYGTGSAGGLSGFDATFYGNDHKVTVGDINYSSSNYVGFFGSIWGNGKVYNLSVEVGNISGNDYVGGFVGRNYNSIIKNSSVVVNSITSNSNYVGGFVGQNLYGTIADSSAVSNSISSSSSAGGFVGQNLYGTITDSSAVSNSISSSSSAGGFVGQNSRGTITDGLAILSNVSTVQFNVGGFVGYNYNSGAISNSSVVVNRITNSIASNSGYVGGFVGTGSNGITGSVARVMVLGGVSSNIGTGYYSYSSTGVYATGLTNPNDIITTKVQFFSGSTEYYDGNKLVIKVPNEKEFTGTNYSSAFSSNNDWGDTILNNLKDYWDNWSGNNTTPTMTGAIESITGASIVTRQDTGYDVNYVLTGDIISGNKLKLSLGSGSYVATGEINLADGQITGNYILNISGVFDNYTGDNLVLTGKLLSGNTLLDTYTGSVEFISCPEDKHLDEDNNTCISNTQTEESTNYTRTRTWDGTSWSDWTYTCKNGYTGNICQTAPSSGGGGGGGGGYYYIPTCGIQDLTCENGVYSKKEGVSCNGGDLGKTCSVVTGNIDSTDSVVTGNIELTKKEFIFNIKQSIKEIKFTSQKMKNILKILTKLIEKELGKIYFIYKLDNSNDYIKFGESYVEFIKTLAKYDAKKITKTQLKVVAKKFLKQYKDYKQKFDKLIKEEIIFVNGVKVSLYKVKKWENKKVAKAFNLLDSLIKKYAEKKDLTRGQIKDLYENYNNFKLAVKYMKEVNKAEGKELAKEYFKNMLPLLKK